MSFKAIDEYRPPKLDILLPTIRRYMFDDHVMYSLIDYPEMEEPHEIVMSEDSFKLLYLSIGKVLEGKVWGEKGDGE